MTAPGTMREIDQAAALRRRVGSTLPVRGARRIAVVAGRAEDGAERVAAALADGLALLGRAVGLLRTERSGHETLRRIGRDATRHQVDSDATTFVDDADCERLVILLGTERGERNARHWQRADRVVLVCRAEVESLTAAYGAAKHWLRVAGRAPLSLVIDSPESPDEARRFAERFDESCRRFLRQPNDYLGELPSDRPTARLGAEERLSSRLAALRLAERIERRTEVEEEGASAVEGREASEFVGMAPARFDSWRRAELAPNSVDLTSIATGGTTDRTGRVT